MAIVTRSQQPIRYPKPHLTSRSFAKLPGRKNRDAAMIVSAQHKCTTLECASWVGKIGSNRTHERPFAFDALVIGLCWLADCGLNRAPDLMVGARVGNRDSLARMRSAARQSLVGASLSSHSLDLAAAEARRSSFALSGNVRCEQQQHTKGCRGCP